MGNNDGAVKDEAMCQGSSGQRTCGPCARQQALRPFQMRDVVHASFQSDDAGVPGVCKRRYERIRLLHGLARRREDLVDDRHLRRVDGELAGKAIAFGR